MKPSEYPERMLKVLFNAYNDPENASVIRDGMAFNTLWNGAGLIADFEDREELPGGKVRSTYGPFYEVGMAALEQMKARRWVDLFKSSHDLRIKLRDEGLRHADWVLRPWYRKAWDFLTKPVPLAITILGIIVGIAGIVIALTR